MTTKEMDSRQLDALVAEKIFGWTQIEAEFRGVDFGMQSHWFVPSGIAPDGIRREQIPAYSISIADAWTVVEKMRADGWFFECGDVRVTTPKLLFASFWKSNEYRQRASAQAERIELAICEAALRAVGEATPND